MKNDHNCWLRLDSRSRPVVCGADDFRAAGQQFSSSTYAFGSSYSLTDNGTEYCLKDVKWVSADGQDVCRSFLSIHFPANVALR